MGRKIDFFHVGVFFRIERNGIEWAQYQNATFFKEFSLDANSSKWFWKLTFFTLGYFFELKETESNEASAKIDLKNQKFRQIST